MGYMLCSALNTVVTTKRCLNFDKTIYLQNIYNRDPLLPKYVDIWGVLPLQRYDDYMDSNDALGFKVLVKETVMLFIMLGTDRKQVLFTLSTGNITFREIRLFFFPTKL